MGNGFSYLGGKKWSEITRDERTFCMYLFKAFEHCPEKLLEIIQTSNPLKEYGWIADMTTDEQEWELAYEVCFYRDLLYQRGKGVKAASDELKSPKFKISNPDKLIKRTFDLCLFSESEIIIIEAKAAQKLKKKQFTDFDMDEEYIKKVIGGLFPNLAKTKIPKVKMVVLASSDYFKSPSFSLKNGVGKNFILDKKGENRKVFGAISWNELYHFLKAKNIGTSKDQEMVKRADESYKLKLPD
jgi:hypothetical protein